MLWEDEYKQRIKNGRRQKKTKRPLRFQFKAQKIVVESCGFCLREAYDKAQKKLNRMNSQLVIFYITHYRERSFSLCHRRCSRFGNWKNLERCL